MINKAIISSPHRHDGSSISAVMLKLLIALTPGLLASIWFLGSGVLIQCLLAVLFAITFETLMLRLRKLPVRIFLKDYSAVVTALLFALCLSPYTPWWINMLGIAFAIIVTKHVFGGIGNNLFNPAVAGYIFVLISFPDQLLSWPILFDSKDQMSNWLQPISIIFFNQNPFDVVSSATPLTELKTSMDNMLMVHDIIAGPMFGMIAGKGWEIINLCFLFGGVWLIMNQVISWHIPITLLSCFAIISLCFHWYDPDLYISPFFHLFSGAIMLGAFFIATDPVTSCSTNRGKILFACGITIITFIIRTWGAYPEGLAFAVLIMNSIVPWLDSMTRPAALGEKNGK